MKRLAIALFIMLSSCSSSELEQGFLTELTLKKALPLDGLEGAEPSGLTMYNNELFTISDDHDDTIYRIRILPDVAVLEPYIQFELDKPRDVEKLDFEGITCDESGNFYLASESTYRVLRISHDGSEVAWITDSLKPIGQKKGMFQKKNANLEGIVYLENGEFVVCTERETRGIFRFKDGDGPEDILVMTRENSMLDHPKNRHPDYTGLCYNDGLLYILERGAYAISQIDISSGSIIEKKAWSYARIEKSDSLKYLDMKYGRGEGLYMDGDTFYVVIDNNGERRVSDEDDDRPLLLIMETSQF